MKIKEGILVATSHHIEYLLPWWWYHYSLHNYLPVAFVDLGMTAEARSFCKERGSVIDFIHPSPHAGAKECVDKQLRDRWETVHGKGLWQTRIEWFKKPFVFALSPFEKTLWLDLDCEVRSPIDPILSACECPAGIALTPEADGYQKVFRELGFCDAEETIYNSGVVPYITQSHIIQKWVEEASFHSHKYISDQDALSSLLHREKILFTIMPFEMNWDRGHGPSDEALIFHWHGKPGKQMLKKEIEVLEQIGWLQPIGSTI